MTTVHDATIEVNDLETFVPTAEDEAAWLGYQLGLEGLGHADHNLDLGRDRSTDDRWAFLMGIAHGRVAREYQVGGIYFFDHAA